MRPFVPMLAVFAACLLAAGADEERSPVEPKSLPLPDQKMEPVKPSVEKLDGTRYRIGKITFDSKTREIRFPAAVNMTDGLLEFAIVHENGKIHESLLHTDISALNLNLAFKLLSYPASAELYMIPNESGGLSGDFHEVPEEVSKGARISISVEWDDGGRTRKVPINEWIQYAVTGTTMPSRHWVYGGSGIYDGKFLAETTGDIAAIFITNASLINYPGDDNLNDTVWLAYPKRVPPEGTKVTVVIAPYQDAETPPNP
jgi:hypothetical protein